MLGAMLTKLTAEGRSDDSPCAAARAAARPEAGALSARAAEPADVAITVRPALPGDTVALARLAELDPPRLPAGPFLIAQADGQLRAALSLCDGASVADPFHPAAATVQLFAARAEQSTGQPRRMGPLVRALRAGLPRPRSPPRAHVIDVRAHRRPTHNRKETSMNTYVRGALLGALACLAAAGLAIPPPAAANPPTSLTNCQDINTPGKYRLDADVSTSSPFCFYITANDVTLDLNGHTLTGDTFSRSAVGIVMASAATNANIVGPGTITGFEGAILGTSSNSSVRGVTATNNTYGGIELHGAGNDVRGNVVTGSGVGIFVDQGSTGNTIIGNYAHNNGSDDLFDQNANCDSNVWNGNDFGTANQSCIN